jgi:hypothetical protein
MRAFGTATASFYSCYKLQQASIDASSYHSCFKLPQLLQAIPQLLQASNDASSYTTAVSSCFKLA